MPQAPTPNTRNAGPERRGRYWLAGEVVFLICDHQALCFLTPQYLALYVWKLHPYKGTLGQCLKASAGTVTSLSMQGAGGKEQGNRKSKLALY